MKKNTGMLILMAFVTVMIQIGVTTALIQKDIIAVWLFSIWLFVTLVNVFDTLNK